jgi:hypothetical protein
MDAKEIKKCKQMLSLMLRSDAREALADYEIPKDTICKAIPDWKEDEMEMEPLELNLLDPYLEKIPFAKMRESCIFASGPA